MTGFTVDVICLEHDKTNNMTCALRKDSDQPWHLPGLFIVFAVCMKNL